MTTGLIEGWQHFADDLRGDNPLLRAAMPGWARCVTAGFDDATPGRARGSLAAAIGQHVIVARVAGVARSGGTVAAGADNAAPRHGCRRRRAAADSGLALARSASLRRRPGRTARAAARTSCASRDARAAARSDRAAGAHDRLMDLGFDSLMAVQLRNRLGAGLAADEAAAAPR